ncbi:MAG: hypothetical protein MZV64_52610 [Ignavibacteriales bacterium]|nr:hypothetical protein [Ignavibacteriales bacterium]
MSAAISTLCGGRRPGTTRGSPGPRSWSSRRRRERARNDRGRLGRRTPPDDSGRAGGTRRRGGPRPPSSACGPGRSRPRPGTAAGGTRQARAG